MRIALALGGTALSVRYAASDPMEYDLKKVQNARSGGEGAEIYRASDVAVEILGERRPARLVTAPLFDPDGARMRG